MAYVAAGYLVTLGGLGAYAASLVHRRKQLSGQWSRRSDAR